MSLFRRRSNENSERDVLRHDVISFEVEPLTKRSQGEALLSAAPLAPREKSFEVEPLTKRSQGEALLSAAPLAPREKSEIFPAGAPCEITKCRTEGIAIVTRSVNRVGLDVQCVGNAPSDREAGALQAA